MTEFDEEWYQDYLKKKGLYYDPLDRDKKPKKSKYNNKKTKIDGLYFDSKKEADYYTDLVLLLRAEEIKGFCRQPEFILERGNTAERAITYKADFIVFNIDGSTEIVDVKGYESQQWKRTFKLFRLKYPELKLKVVK